MSEAVHEVSAEDQATELDVADLCRGNLPFQIVHGLHLERLNSLSHPEQGKQYFPQHPVSEELRKSRRKAILAL